MIGILHEFIGQFDAVFHAIEPDIHKVYFQVIEQRRFLFNHAGNFQYQFIAAEVDEALDSWGDAGELDLLTAMNEITIRTAGRCLIGAEFRMGMAKEFARLYHDLEGGIKSLGDNPVKVELHSEVVAEINVSVVAAE